jgi:integrase
MPRKKHPNTLYIAGDYVTLRKRKGKYLFIDCYEDGERKYISFGKDFVLKGNEFDALKIEKAKEIAMKHEKEIQAKGMAWLMKGKLKINFVDFFERIAREKNTKPYSNTLAHLRRFLGAKKWFLLEITDADLALFQKYLLKQVSDTSVHTYMTVLKTAFTIARKENLLDERANPFTDFEIVKRGQTQREYLTFDELQRLNKAECADYDTKRAFLFACYTGLRISDIRALTWKDVQNNRIEIKMQKTDDVLYVDLNDSAQDLLGFRCKQASDASVFTLPEEKRLGRVLLRWAKNAAIEKHVTFHVARHTFATLLLTSGTDIYTASKLLGHKDVKVTQIYAKIVDEKKKAAINSLPTL